MKHLSTLAGVLAALLAFAPLSSQGAQARPAQVKPNYGKIVSQSYDPVAQITETHLANGLTILTKESHAAPVVELRVVYKVGSLNEISGETGISHILEHMMFKGTWTLPAGAIDYLFRQAGADNNAQTGTDDTQYHELVPSNRLEAMIRLEADRMENSAFRPKDLASEMTVVRSELEGDTESPGYELYCYGLLPVAFSANPYRWPAIGFVSDVEAVQHNRAVIYAYYKAHYMPNNAVVTIVGDFKTAKAVAMCQKYFGVYPAGQLEHHHITPEPLQTGPKRVVLRRAGTTGEMLVAYHDPGLGTPGHYTMDVIGTILSGGVSTRMYQDMVASGLAQSASFDDEDTKDPYLDVFDAVPQQGVSLDKLEAAIASEVKKLQTTPVSAQELRQAVNQIDASYVYEKDSINSQSADISLYAAISKQGYKYENTYLKHIHQVTPQMIRAVAQKVFVDDNKTVAEFEPLPLKPGQTLPPPPSGEHFGSRQTTGRQAARFAPIAKAYGLDNLSNPKVTSRPDKIVLPNGLTLIVQQNHAVKDVAIAGYVKAGTYFSLDNRQIAAMTAQLAQRGTATKTYLQLAQQLDAVGAGIGLSPSLQTVSISGECLTKDFGLTMGTLADELQNASFPQDQLDKSIAQDISEIEQERQDTGSTGSAGPQAEIAFSQALFPAGSPFRLPSIDRTEAETKAMTRRKLLDFYHAYYRPDSTVLTIVGDVTDAQAKAVVTGDFGSWTKPATPTPQITIPETPLPTKAPAPVLLALPGAPQTSILYGFPGELKRTDSDWYAAMLANYVLGGDLFGSRLGHQIRDVEGLTYTVYSYFDAELGAGAWEAFAGTNPNNADRTLAEIKRITKQYVAQGATPEELRQAKIYITGSFPSSIETNAGIAALLTHAELYHLGLDFPNRYVSKIDSVTLAQVHAAARKLLHPNLATVVLSGATPK